MDALTRPPLKLVEDDFESSSKKEICLPDPPETMTSYEAKCEWIESVGDLVEKGIFVGPNISLFYSYCVATGQARELEKILEEDGRIVGGKAHPAYRMMLDAMSTARSIWAEIKPKKLVIKEEEEENNWKNDKGLLA